MQRLMRRFREDDRGAVAVVVAIVMVALLGMAAIAVDVSASYARKHQLQNGADAGALAVAQNCARNACGSPIATAQSYVTANSYDGTATALVVGPNGGVVTVKATDPSYKHWFAPVLDPKFNSSVISAVATAKYGWPIAGSTLPLTFSICEWNAQVGGLDSTTEHVINFPKKSDSGCNGPSGNPVPGGFAWVKPDGGLCTKASAIEGWLDSDTGNTPPSPCTVADLQKLIGTTLLIPIYDQVNGDPGNNAKYHIYGYAAFKLTGYFFGGQYEWPVKKGPCSGNNRCIKGYFTRYVDLNEVLEIGTTGPQLGAAIVTLEK